MRSTSRLRRLYDQTEQVVTIEEDSAPRVLFAGEDLLVEDLPVGAKVI